MRLHNLLHFVLAIPLAACASDTTKNDDDDTDPRCDPADLGAYDVGWEASHDPSALRLLLKDIPAGTAWADLPQTTRDTMSAHAAAVRARYAARWGADAMAARTHVLTTCPTAEMVASFDELVPLVHRDAMLPPGFVASKDIASPALRAALKKLHLLHYAMMRENVFYREGFPDHDWDGSSFRGTEDGLPPSDPTTFAAHRAYGQQIVADLRALDDNQLGEVDRALKQSALYRARSYASGSHRASITLTNGGEDDTTFFAFAKPATILDAYTADEGLPKTFTSAEGVLEVINAAWNVQPTKWIDVGTVPSGISLWGLSMFSGLKSAPKFSEDPANADLVKAYTLLQNWAFDRAKAMPEAVNRCSIFTEAERAQVWDSWTADSLFNNDGAMTMQAAAADVAAHRTELLATYRARAIRAVDTVFADNTVLSTTQRAAVHAKIEAETVLPTLPDRIAPILQEVTGNATAGQAFVAARAAAVPMLGGGYAAGAMVRAEEKAMIEAMWVELKDWLRATYSGRTVDIGAILDQLPPLKYNTGSSGFTISARGGISVGLAASYPKSHYYLWLIFKTHEALNRSYRFIATDPETVRGGYSGAHAVGAAFASQLGLMEKFLTATLHDPAKVALLMLYKVRPDTLQVASTDATLARFMRTSSSPTCSDPAEPDAIAFARGIAANWGLDETETKDLVSFSNAGAYKLHFVLASDVELDIQRYLQQHVAPSSQISLDPFTWFACGIPGPRKDEKTVKAFGACLGLGGTQ